MIRICSSLVISLVLLTLLNPVMTSVTTAQEKSDVLVFRNIRIFDGIKIVPHRSVIVRDGKISWVGTDVEIPEGAEIIEGEDLTLLPGLIDSHTHVFFPADLKQALIFGVTTELDMFTNHKMAKDLKQKQTAGEYSDFADLRSAGTLATAPGGHGTQYGLKFPTLTDASEAQAFVDDRIAEGSDYIKIILEDGKFFNANMSTLEKELVAALANAAHKRDKLAVVHVTRYKYARMAMESGADCLAHIFFDNIADSDFIGLFEQRNSFIIPTLTVFEDFLGTSGGQSLIEDPRVEPYLSEFDKTNLHTSFPLGEEIIVYETIMDTIGQLKAAGIPILAGTDAPNPGTTHGASMHRELELLVEIGLTPAEALAAATSIPAEKFDLNDRGRIAKDLRADLLLVKGNPVVDITATRNIVGVWKLGVKVDRDAYRDGIERERLAEKSPPPPGSESGIVSDFDSGKMTTEFGYGWFPATDSIMKGKSKVEINIIEGGALETTGALSIQGETKEGSPYPWAGVMFYPGPGPMAPANLSGKKELNFWTKGDGKEYMVMIFTKDRNIPSFQFYTADSEWKEITLELSNFSGVNTSQITGVFFGFGMKLDNFSVLIDQVSFK